MRVLLTGANGMLAHEIARQWAARHEIVALAHADLDIADLDAVRAVAGRVRPDLIVNGAAYNRVDDAEAHHAAAFRANEHGPRILAETADSLGIPLVHFSTDYVFDGTKGEPYVETDPVHPLGVYGKSKEAGERAVRKATDRHYLVRVAWLAGHGGKNFIETMLRVGAEKGRVAVVTDQTGAPTFCTDVARNLERLAESGRFGTYHMTNAGTCTWHEFAAEIFRQAGMKDVVVDETTTAALGRAAPRPRYSALRNAGLEKLGVDEMTDWRESLARYLADRERT